MNNHTRGTHTEIKMKKFRTGRMSMLLVAGLACWAVAAFAESSIFPTGTTIYNPAKAYSSFVLFTSQEKVSRLIDMNGNVVHQWPDEGDYSSMIDPELDGGKLGHVLVTLSMTNGAGIDLVPGRANERVSHTIGELDWDGKTVWQFGEKAPSGNAMQHHDWSRLPNGNTLVLSTVRHHIPGFTQDMQSDDAFYEVNPAGEIVWKWLASDHLNELGLTPDELKLMMQPSSVQPGAGDYLHINNMKIVGPNQWFDEGDKRFDPNNIIFCSRNANITAIVDRQSGKIVWTIGPDYPASGSTGRGFPHPVDQISGQHDAQIITKGLPGAGNVLIFDNQGEAGYPTVPMAIIGGTRVVEIDPVKKQIVWQYSAADSGMLAYYFRSAHIGGVRRLPNGNTFIDEGEQGRFFQVTPQGEIVWEYLNPYPGRTKNARTGVETRNYSVYRAQPVPYSWIPAGTPHTEKAVIPPDPTQFHLPAVP